MYPSVTTAIHRCAYGVLYLASDESKFSTGTELVIDGGYLGSIDERHPSRSAISTPVAPAYAFHDVFGQADELVDVGLDHRLRQRNLTTETAGVRRGSPSPTRISASLSLE